MFQGFFPGQRRPGERAFCDNSDSKLLDSQAISARSSGAAAAFPRSYPAAGMVGGA